jgi:hypothetical protein
VNRSQPAVSNHRRSPANGLPSAIRGLVTLSPVTYARGIRYDQACQAGSPERHAMNVEILDEAKQDGCRFYEHQWQGFGEYFLDSPFADMDALQLYSSTAAATRQNWGFP